jgi:hypothetical protein
MASQNQPILARVDAEQQKDEVEETNIQDLKKGSAGDEIPF